MEPLSSNAAQAALSLKRTVVYGLTGRARFFGFALERVTSRSIRDPWRFKAAHMRRSQKHLLMPSLVASRPRIARDRGASR